MKNTLKVAAAGGILLAGSMAFSQSVLAVETCADLNILDMKDWYDNSSASGGGVGCKPIDNDGNPGDKIFDLVGIGGDLTVAGLSDITGAIVIDDAGVTYQFTLGPKVPPFETVGSFEFSYSVEIDDPDFVFDAVAISADISSFSRDIVVTKEIYDGERGAGGVLVADLEAQWNSGDTSNLPGLTKIWVYETVDVDQGNSNYGSEDGKVNSVTNEFLQTVPEPMSGALVGLGLIGMGMARRRKIAA